MPGKEVFVEVAFTPRITRTAYETLTMGEFAGHRPLSRFRQLTPPKLGEALSRCVQCQATPPTATSSRVVGGVSLHWFRVSRRASRFMTFKSGRGFCLPQPRDAPSFPGRAYGKVAAFIRKALIVQVLEHGPMSHMSEGISIPSGQRQHPSCPLRIGYGQRGYR